MGLGLEAAGLGTHENRFTVEMNGFAIIEATEITGMALDHTVFELFVGNRPNPLIGRGNFKAEEITIRHGHALNRFGEEFFSWMRAVIRGESVERRTFRFIVRGEDGRTVIAEYEARRCLPRRFEEDGHNAGGTNAAMFKAVIRPEDFDLIS
jgi:phage tail-like protein